MAPAGRVEDVFQFGGEIGRTLHIAPQGFEFVHGDFNGMIGINVIRNAIDGFLALVFFLERAEQPVPDDEDARVVAVEVEVVGGVMDAVVRGRVENPFERTELADELRVWPELKDEVE